MSSEEEYPLEEGGIEHEFSQERLLRSSSSSGGSRRWVGSRFRVREEQSNLQTSFSQETEDSPTTAFQIPSKSRIRRYADSEDKATQTEKLEDAGKEPQAGSSGYGTKAAAANERKNENLPEFPESSREDNLLKAQDPYEASGLESPGLFRPTEEKYSVFRTSAEEKHEMLSSLGKAIDELRKTPSELPPKGVVIQRLSYAEQALQIKRRQDAGKVTPKEESTGHAMKAIASKEGETENASLGAENKGRPVMLIPISKSEQKEEPLEEMNCSGGGWDGNEIFRANEERHGVPSSFIPEDSRKTASQTPFKWTAERSKDSGKKALETERREAAGRKAPQTDSVDLVIKAAAANARVSANSEGFPESVDRILYETFLGAEYEGKPIVDMFGFTESQKQELEDWSKAKRDFLSAVCGDPVFVAKHVEKVGPNVRYKYGDKNTALMLASASGNLTVVIVLTLAGARVNDTNLRGRTALMEAAECGHLDVVKHLVKHKADLNVKDENGDTALNLALKKGHSTVAKFLESEMRGEKSSKGSDVTVAAAPQSQSPMSEDDPAEMQGAAAYREGVSENLDSKGQAKEREREPLDIHRGVEDLSRCETIVITARKIAPCTILLGTNKDDSRDIAPERVVMFKERPADTEKKAMRTERQEDARKRAPQACCLDNMKASAAKARARATNFAVFPESVERILYDVFLGTEYEGKPVVDMFGFSESEKKDLAVWSNIKKDFLKAVSGDPVFVAKHVQYVGPNVREKYRDKSTALMLACASGNLTVVIVLVLAGARVNDTNLRGRTAVMEAAECGNLDVVEYLVKHRADLNIRDENGDTALCLAQKKGHSKVAKFLKSEMSRQKSEDSDSAAQQQNLSLVHEEDPTEMEGAADLDKGQLILHKPQLASEDSLGSKDSVLSSPAARETALKSCPSPHRSEQVVPVETARDTTDDFLPFRD